VGPASSVLIGLALLGGLYVYWGGLEAPGRRVASFAAALVVLGLALNGPLHNLSDSYLFSAHMTQHLVLTLVFPPLLLYGTPAAVVRPLLRPRWVFGSRAGPRVPSWRARSFPCRSPCGTFRNSTRRRWSTIRCTSSSTGVHRHGGDHVVARAVARARAAESELPYPAPISLLARLSMSIAGAMITLAEGVLYPFYTTAPRVWGLAPLADQQLGVC